MVAGSWSPGRPPGWGRTRCACSSVVVPQAVAAGRRRERLEALAAELVDAPGRVVPCVADVTSEPDVERLVATAVAELGGIDVLLNNAGAEVQGGLDALALADLEGMLRSNVVSVFLVHARRARRAAAQPGRGRQPRVHRRRPPAARPVRLRREQGRRRGDRASRATRRKPSTTSSVGRPRSRASTTCWQPHDRVQPDQVRELAEARHLAQHAPRRRELGLAAPPRRLHRHGRHRRLGRAPGHLVAVGRPRGVDGSARPTCTGIHEQSVVDDADVAELVHRRPDARVVEVDAGHSVQGDAPLELARIVDSIWRH